MVTVTTVTNPFGKLLVRDDLGRFFICPSVIPSEFGPEDYWCFEVDNQYRPVWLEQEESWGGPRRSTPKFYIYVPSTQRAFRPEPGRFLATRRASWLIGRRLHLVDIAAACLPVAKRDVSLWPSAFRLADMVAQGVVHAAYDTRMIGDDMELANEWHWGKKPQSGPKVSTLHQEVAKIYIPSFGDQLDHSEFADNFAREWHYAWGYDPINRAYGGDLQHMLIMELTARVVSLMIRDDVVRIYSA